MTAYPKLGMRVAGSGMDQVPRPITTGRFLVASMASRTLSRVGLGPAVLMALPAISAIE